MHDATRAESRAKSVYITSASSQCHVTYLDVSIKQCEHEQRHVDDFGDRAQ
jgi:hypothetical protein